MRLITRMPLPTTAIVAATILAAGCTLAEEIDTKGLTVESIPIPATDIGRSPSPPVGPGLQRLVDMATKSLATKLGIEETGIKVTEAAYVSWPDSSTGCPQPGMQYMHVLSNGSRIVLKANTGVYHYHSGGNRPPTYCAKPSALGPLPYAPGET